MTITTTYTDNLTVPAEDEFTEYFGDGGYLHRNAGSEFIEFNSIADAAQFMQTIRDSGIGCGMIIRSPELARTGSDQVLRLRDGADKPHATDRVFFRKSNLVGQVAVALDTNSSISADALAAVLVKKVK